MEDSVHYNRQQPTYFPLSKQIVRRGEKEEKKEKEMQNQGKKSWLGEKQNDIFEANFVGEKSTRIQNQTYCADASNR